MRILILTLLLTFTYGSPPTSVYDFPLKTIDGKDFSLARFKGEKILVVNTASKCGYTPQYADLEKLSQMYKGKVVVVGFPENDFANQDPGTNSEIQTFCKKNYGVTFPLSEKVDVIGPNISPLFKYLTSAPNPDFTGDVKWNFEKFLIDANGKLIRRYRSPVKPLDTAITNQL